MSEISERITARNSATISFIHKQNSYFNKTSYSLLYIGRLALVSKGECFKSSWRMSLMKTRYVIESNRLGRI